MPGEDRACFEQALLAELFGRAYATRAEAATAADRLSSDEQNLCLFLDEAFTHPALTISTPQKLTTTPSR
jgi:hypothetical protein